MSKTYKYSEDQMSCDGCGEDSSHLKAARGGRYCRKCFGYRMEHAKQAERVWREDEPLK